MKYIIILGDGMADEPIAELGGKTPVEYADTPAIDRLARLGRQGRLVTVPEGFHPGSEVANMGVLGYDVRKSFEGRGSLEAASMGIPIEDGEMAMRCNVICVTADGRIKNHSAGHISTEEATELINYLNEKLGDERVSFYPGVSYRHLLKMKGGDKRISCTPPHDVPGAAFRDVLVKADVPEAEATAARLNELILRSQEILAEHPVNKARVAAGKDAANSIWPWSPGYKPSMLTMGEEHGIKAGKVISAVDLIKGIGVYAGLEVIEVEGATGLYDTNYEGKAQAAIDALRNGADFVFLHIEASDEAGHDGDVALKVRTVEYLDHRVVAPIVRAVEEMEEPVTIAVLPDHPTPCRLKTHTMDPVPFLIYRPGGEPDETQTYGEREALKGAYGLINTTEFINLLLHSDK